VKKSNQILLILVSFILFSVSGFCEDGTTVNKMDLAKNIINILYGIIPFIALGIAKLYAKVTHKKIAEGEIAKVLNTGLAMAKATIEKPVTNEPSEKKVYEKNLMNYAVDFVNTEKENNHDFKKSLKSFGKNVLKDFGNDLIQENLERVLHGKKLGLPKIKFKFSTKF